MIRLPHRADKTNLATCFRQVRLELQPDGGDTMLRSGAATLGRIMRKSLQQGRSSVIAPEANEFDALLREIEKEAVPAKLLELAFRLQAMLAQRNAAEADATG